MNKTLLSGVALAIAASLPAQWNQASPSPDAAGRIGAGMAYDPTTGACVMFGGNLASSPFGGPYTNETWRYDGTSWLQQSPAISPPGSVGVQLVHDANRGVFVTYGSLNTSPFGGAAVDQTWEYDGSTWTEVFPVHTPGGLGNYAMCYDALRNKVVLHGGEIDGWILFYSNQTWEYDGTDWSLVTTANNPGTLERAAMCFHQGLGVSVLFGGQDPFVGTFDKTWTFDGSNWTEVVIPGVRPAPRQGCSLVYDNVRQVCVMTGGVDQGVALNDTWELDLANLTWTQISSAYTTPRYSFGAAFDLGRRQVVLQGGTDTGFGAINGTWEYGAKNSTFGSGCAGSNGVPALTAADAPRLGQSFTLNATGLNTTINLGVMVLSGSEIPGGLALDFLGMTGCTGYVSPDILFTVAGAGGTASWTATMPGNVALLGGDLFAQMLSFDPVNPASLVATNAQHGVLGF